MPDTTAIKVDAAHPRRGGDGEIYLASGRSPGMRMWRDEPPGEARPAVRRACGTVGTVIAGRAELTIEGQTVLLAPGNSWVVPRGAEHGCRILEAPTAVEATHPPHQVHGRDAG